MRERRAAGRAEAVVGANQAAAARTRLLVQLVASIVAPLGHRVFSPPPRPERSAFFSARPLWRATLPRSGQIIRAYSMPASHNGRRGSTRDRRDCRDAVTQEIGNSHSSIAVS